MLILRVMVVFVILCLASVQAAQVIAQLSGNTVEAGQGVMLTLQVEGGSVQGDPVFPQVENLIINQRGKSQQMRVVNGKVSRSVNYSYVVGSMQPGEYVIPAATVKVGGKEFKTQALKLTVRPGANGAPAGMGNKGDTESAEEKAGEFRQGGVKIDQAYGMTAFLPLISSIRHPDDQRDTRGFVPDGPFH